jgi:GTPase SAR1 family protein
MMQLINDLRSLGGETMMDLPSIVVIGCQSAGKSSLVEAVSGVTVPRDSGTCTRCPMECTMSSNATTWSCTIKIRFDYDSFGQSAVQHQKEISFGPTITNKDDVEIWLRRAQTAILNPDISPETFHRKSIQELKDFTLPNTLKFSKNIVSVFLEDPNAIDLSFVDLPGLIQNEDEEVVNLVRQLTESYIKRPNTIILTTIPMSDDMENQLSVTLAKHVDPQGERTIGILTKPDMLSEGSVNARQSWLDVIEGRKHKLNHGYYCVRLPDDAQRAQRLSRSAFQRIAADYFDTTAPWSGVADRGRFGIPAFVTDISVLLVNHIKKVIPELRRNAEQLLASCLEEIDGLPKALDVDPQIEVLARVNAFCNAFQGVVSGSHSDKDLAQKNRACYTIFARKIRGTSPDFRPFDTPRQYRQMELLDPEELDQDRDSRVKIMGVYDVRKTITESIAWELPGNIPYEAKTRLIGQFTALWSTPAEKCLASINDVLDQLIQQLLDKHFGRFRFLQDLISDLIRPDIKELKDSAQSAVKGTLALEISPILAQNRRDYDDLRDKWLNRYRRARRNPGDRLIPAQSPPQTPTGYDSVFDSLPTFTRLEAPAVPSSQESNALNYLAQAGYRGITVEDLVRLTPRDNFEDELIVMADVRAYFTIACKRFVDHAPLKIHQSLHLALAERLSVNLLGRLIGDTNATGDFADRMKELVREDPGIEAKRVRLEATRVRLQEMKKKLASFAE